MNSIISKKKDIRGEESCQNGTNSRTRESKASVIAGGSKKGFSFKKVVLIFYIIKRYTES